jgi:threonine dehydrogenase-like Zn-dependent dehydrogenase
MKAVVYHGKCDLRVDTVPDPKIEEPRDAIVKVTSTAICGSDLHLYDGYIPEMHDGDVLGQTHRRALDDAPKMYDTFKKKEDGCIKVVMNPHA